MQTEIPAQSQQVLEAVRPLFGGSLLGFYLYGPAVHGACARTATSTCWPYSAGQ